MRSLGFSLQMMGAFAEFERNIIQISDKQRVSLVRRLGGSTRGARRRLMKITFEQ